MDQDQNSTASFGSVSNMTSGGTTNVAMVGQTVDGDSRSSMEQSPAQSSESELGIARTGHSGGVGQERSDEQILPAPSLPTIQDQDGETEEIASSQSMLPHSAPGSPLGATSYVTNSQRLGSGPQTPVKKEPAYAKIVSTRSPPRTGLERKSGQSTPVPDYRKETNKLVESADQQLQRLIDERQCSSPGVNSQSSQRALPAGSSLGVDESRRSYQMTSPYRFPLAPSLPDGSIPSRFGTPDHHNTSASFPPKVGVSSAFAAGALEDVISSSADVLMGNTGKTGSQSPHSSLMVNGPVQHPIAMQWAERNTKRSLEGSTEESLDKKSSSSSHVPVPFRPSPGQQMSDAAFFVSRMSQQNEDLDRRLKEESRSAENAAAEYLQHSNLSNELRSAEMQKFRQCELGLAAEYQRHTEVNCLQVDQDRERGSKINAALRSELVEATQQWTQLEANAVTHCQHLSDKVSHWHSESQKESYVAKCRSEQTIDANMRCDAAEAALRQRQVPNVHYGQAEVQDAVAKVAKVEQDALQYVQQYEQQAATRLATSVQQYEQQAATRLATSEHYSQTLFNELSVSAIDIQTAKYRSDQVDAELVRVNSRLAHSQAEVHHSQTGSAQSHASRSKAQSDLDQIVKELEALKEKYETMCLLEGEEATESERNSEYGYLENHLYIQTYGKWQQALSAPRLLTSDPPGLPPAAATHASSPAAAATSRESREESSLKVKEADKVNCPSFPTITNLASWQSSLSQALVQTSGVRDVRIIMEWISAVWAPGAKIDHFADSGGEAFVTLDVKLSVSLQHIISHGGQDARELKDAVNRKMDECMKQMTLLTGRQIVFMLLENFKTFDNSEMVYGFDHLVKCECDKDLSAVATSP